MKYLIGSGYYSKHPASEKNELGRLTWNTNATGQYVKIGVGGSLPPVGANAIGLSGNLGHIDDLVVTKTKDHKFCGWSGAMLALAMIAYCDESDFIYKEQDCLAFGPWVERMYAQLENGKVIFGSCKIQPAAQSLFLVKHDYIPEFVRLYLSCGPDNLKTNLPEMKFATLQNQHPAEWRRFTLGFDRDRPDEGLEKFLSERAKQVHPEPFYLQQITGPELDLLKEFSLV